MHLTYLLFHKEAWITTPAVHILTNQQEISISPAQKHLQYKPKIKYQTAIKNIETWINNTPSWQNPSKDPR